MGYLDQLRQASFRGVNFFVESSQVAGGRRAVQHQFPNRETPFTEDNGRQAKSYQIDGHIIGDDYLTAKKTLFEVFEKQGPGELIHPYYGSMFVQVSALNVSESNKEGAIATFSITFLEIGNDQFPKGINDKGSILNDAAIKGLAEAKDDFDSSFSVAGMPAFAVQSARDLIKNSQELFDSTTSPLADLAEGLADLSFATRNLVAETNDLLQSPQKLSQRLLDSFQLMADAISNAKLKTKAFNSFYRFELDRSVEGDTPIRRREIENKKTYENFMRRVSVLNATSTAIVSVLASVEETRELRESMTEVLEEQIRAIDVDETNTNLYQSLVDANSAITDVLPDVDNDLPSIKEIEIERDEVSILLAYDLNESLDNEQDIIDRNNIRNPAFISAPDTLEVLGGN